MNPPCVSIKRQTPLFNSPDLAVVAGHVLQPGQSEIWGVLVALGNPVHEVQQHLRVLSKLLHLDCVGQDHVQVEHEVSNLGRSPRVNKSALYLYIET